MLDDLRGVIIDVEVMTRETNEDQVIIERIDAAVVTTEPQVKTVTADAGYAYGKAYGDLERRGTAAAVIPTKTEPIRGPVPLRRCRYDANNDLLRCPRGKICGRPGVSSIGAFSVMYGDLCQGGGRGYSADG